MICQPHDDFVSTFLGYLFWCIPIPWRIHGAAIYGNMDPINTPPMLALIYQHHGFYGNWTIGHDDPWQPLMEWPYKNILSQKDGLFFVMNNKSWDGSPTVAPLELEQVVQCFKICPSSHGLPSGKLTYSYWKWPFIVDLPRKKCDFP